MTDFEPDIGIAVIIILCIFLFIVILAILLMLLSDYLINKNLKKESERKLIELYENNGKEIITQSKKHSKEHVKKDKDFDVNFEINTEGSIVKTEVVYAE